MLPSMEASDEERRAFGEALADALIARGIDKKDFAVELTKELNESVSASSITQWTLGQYEPSRAKVRTRRSPPIRLVAEAFRTDGRADLLAPGSGGANYSSRATPTAAHTAPSTLRNAATSS